MNHMHTLSDDESQALEELHRETDIADVRSRCDMILCTNGGLLSPQVGTLTCFIHDNVVHFIKRYEAEWLT